MKKLGLGVLGLGEGRSIISAAINSKAWEVVQLCDLDEKLGRERSHEFSLDCFTPSLDELLANKRVDVVGIYTPDHLHADHVVKALQADKHVICTKPFLNDLSQAKKILAAQKKSGKTVMVGQSSRFFAPFARQRRHFETGAFGDIITAEAYYNADHRWFFKKGWARTSSFKWLYGGLSHPVDLLRWYLPDIAEVMGYSSLSKNGRKLGLKNDDTFQFIFKSSAGIPARVSGTYNSPVTPLQRDSNMSCVLRCTNGASQADYYDLRYSWKLRDRSCIETFEDYDDYYFRFGGHSHHAGEYQNYIEYFAQCLAARKTPQPNAREGIVTVALMQAMEESCAKGRPIIIKDVLARYDLSHLLKS